MYDVGAVLAGKYRIDRVLGEGGMGMVVAATHVQLNQPVALKLLRPEVLSDHTALERFAREARAAARLRGEHVCHVTDVGELDTGVPFIVMELLTGNDLATLLAHRRLPSATIVDYVLQACLGIAEAHSHKIVHRDLKPANLFVTQRPDGSPLVKVLDFGIAKASGEFDVSLTRSQSILGSPGYMSPEQLRSTRDADVRSDIWALGVILYEAIAGRLPFIAESMPEMVLKIAMDPIPALPSTQPGLADVIDRCLAKDAADRFVDVAELAQALVPFGGPRAAETAEAVARVLDVRGRPITPLRRIVKAVATTLSSASSVTTGHDRKPRWSAVIAATAVAITAVIVLVTRRTGDAVAVDGRPPAPVSAPSSAPPPPSPAPAPSPAPPASPPPPVTVPTSPPPARAVATPAAKPAAKTPPTHVTPRPKPQATKPKTDEDLGDSRI